VHGLVGQHAGDADSGGIERPQPRSDCFAKAALRILFQRPCIRLSGQLTAVHPFATGAKEQPTSRGLPVIGVLGGRHQQVQRDFVVAARHLGSSHDHQPVAVAGGAAGSRQPLLGGLDGELQIAPFAGDEGSRVQDLGQISGPERGRIDRLELRLRFVGAFHLGEDPGPQQRPTIHGDGVSLATRVELGQRRQRLDVAPQVVQRLGAIDVRDRVADRIERTPGLPGHTAPLIWQRHRPTVPTGIDEHVDGRVQHEPAGIFQVDALHGLQHRLGVPHGLLGLPPVGGHGCPQTQPAHGRRRPDAKVAERPGRGAGEATPPLKHAPGAPQEQRVHRGQVDRGQVRGDQRVDERRRDQQGQDVRHARSLPWISRPRTAAARERSGRRRCLGSGGWSLGTAGRRCPGRAGPARTPAPA
jgi:hypothetical protein